jgi:serine/threonine protein kinase
LNPPDGYTLRKCLHTSAVSDVYAAVRESDGRMVVLKRYVKDTTAEGGSRAQREHDALRQVAGPGIPAALELIGGADTAVLVLERAPGLSLGSWVEDGLPPPEAFLDVAIQLADLLARVHDARLLHRDVNPSNVLVDPTDLRISLIGFSLARPLGSAATFSDARSEQQHVPDKLRFFSPEQTGRMDRGVDSRSDLYGLGATLYFALTGLPPFALNDPLALIHAHMAKTATPPLELRRSLPPTLSRIVVKLLQKSPETRYQTARALQRDLVECRDQLLRHGAIDDDFPLATADAPYRPLFSKKLYGRESEVRALLDACARASDAHPTVLMLKGPPGVGKSALVHELRAPLAVRDGYLTSGKFDLYRRDVPYLGLVQAFESLAQQILTESDVRLARWRAELMSSLGQSAGVLVELVPDLGIVLGEVQNVPSLGPAETRARLSLAVQRFVQALAVKEHPLVLFLDDLQWADEGSRDLIRELLTGMRDGALLLLGSYRDTEVEPGHPLLRLLDELREREVPIQELTLDSLSEDACARMLAEALGRTAEETRSLAACVARKTGNTPLLIQQFVYHMYDLQLIRFQLPAGWVWDDAAMTAADIPDDAVGLMTAKIGRLASSVAGVLQLASCVGDDFQLETLAELTDEPRSALEAALFTLCDEGLIAPAPAGFRFVHDRIREGAQARLSSHERTRIHCEAARLLLARIPPEALATRAVEIADHLNLGHDGLDDAERLRAIELNVLAARSALRAGAAVTAAHYTGAGRALFREAHWTAHPQLGFDLFMEAAESAYQMHDVELALKLLSTLETVHPWSRMQAAQIAAKQIMARTLQTSGPRELEFVLQTLGRFGVHWPAYPSRLRARLEILRTDWALRGSLGDDRFHFARPGDHSAWLAPLLVMGASAPTLTRRTIRLVLLLTSFALRNFLRHGFVTSPAFPLIGYAANRLALLQNLRGAERYAAAALEWNARVPHPIYRSRTEFVANAFVYSWTRPRRSIFEGLRKAEAQCREAGDLEYASFACAQRAHHLCLAGEPLSRAAADYAELARRGAHTRIWPNVQPRIFRLLKEPPLNPAELAREVAEIESVLDGTETSRMSQYVFWFEVLCLLGCQREAFATSERIASWISDAGAASSQVVDFTFFRGVLAAQLATQARGGARRRQARLLRSCLRRVRVWARIGPDFPHMVQTLEAERMRLRRHPQAALARYAQAIERASQQGYVHHAAFLHERRAYLLTHLRRSTEAAGALRQATALYEEWGAHGKAEALRRLRAKL